MNDSMIYDPKGLITDAYAIDGIVAAECRSIFLDWALGLPDGRDAQQEVRHLLAHHANQNPPGHPMTETLQAALDAPPKPRRRGGRGARV